MPPRRVKKTLAARLHKADADEGMNMKLQITILILIAAFLAGCVPQARGFGYADVGGYRAKPTVAVSAFTANNSVVMVYVKHSHGGVLLHLAPATMGYELSKRDVNMDVQLDFSEHIVFNSGSYENFDRSRDVFGDGRIILVPLPENNGRAVGAFVNLLSGKRYFFAPTVMSRESFAKLRTVARQWDITVIVPEDRRAQERVGLFPEFRQ
jgi:hypothetical protein